MHNRIKDLVPDRQVEVIEQDQVPPDAKLMGIKVTPQGIEMLWLAPKPEDESAPICPDCGRRHF